MAPRRAARQLLQPRLEHRALGLGVGDDRAERAAQLRLRLGQRCSSVADLVALPLEGRWAWRSAARAAGSPVRGLVEPLGEQRVRLRARSCRRRGRARGPSRRRRVLARRLSALVELQRSRLGVARRSRAPPAARAARPAGARSRRTTTSSRARASVSAPLDLLGDRRLARPQPLGDLLDRAPPLDRLRLELVERLRDRLLRPPARAPRAAAGRPRAARRCVVPSSAASASIRASASAISLLLPLREPRRAAPRGAAGRARGRPASRAGAPRRASPPPASAAGERLAGRPARVRRRPAAAPRRAAAPPPRAARASPRAQRCERAPRSLLARGSPPPARRRRRQLRGRRRATALARPRRGRGRGCSASASSDRPQRRRPRRDGEDYPRPLRRALESAPRTEGGRERRRSRRSSSPQRRLGRRRSARPPSSGSRVPSASSSSPLTGATAAPHPPHLGREPPLGEREQRPRQAAASSASRLERPGLRRTRP